MSTRGAIGFRKDNIDKIAYNHSDSYPNYLGVSIVEFIKLTPINEIRDIADRIILVQDDETPTPTQIKKCMKYFDAKIGSGKIDDWYCLLRDTQGSLSAYKDIPYMIDSHDFMSDSVFCEWAYIINLDTEMLEIYKGYNKSINGNGRYASLKDKDSEYYGVNLLTELPLKDIYEMKYVNKYMDDLEKT